MEKKDTKPSLGEPGATMIEYSLMVALLALAVAFAVTSFSTKATDKFDKAAYAVANGKPYQTGMEGE